MGFPLSGHFEVGHVGDSTMATSCWARVHAKPVTAQEGSSEPGPRRGSRRLSGRRERGASVPSSSGRRACVRSCGVFWWVFGQASYLLFGLWATPGDTGSRWAASWPAATGESTSPMRDSASSDSLDSKTAVQSSPERDRAPREDRRVDSCGGASNTTRRAARSVSRSVVEARSALPWAPVRDGFRPKCRKVCSMASRFSGGVGARR